MSANRSLFWSGLVVWAVLAVLTALFFLPKSYYDLPDVFFTMTSLMTVHQLGVHHMDFGALFRAGYLLNYPFYALGFSIGQMRAVYWAVLFICACVFYLGISRTKEDRWLLPVILMLSFLTAACYYRFMFNYYTVPSAFMMLAVGFFFWGERSQFCLWPVLSALAFTIIGFSSLPLILMCLLTVVVFSLVSWSRQGLILLLSFLVFVLIFGWTYFIHWDVLARLMDLTGHESSYPKGGIQMPLVITGWNLVYTVLAALGVFFIWANQEKLSTRLMPLLMLLAYLCIFVVLSVDVLLHFPYQIVGASYWLFFAFISFGTMVVCYPKMKGSRWNRLYIAAFFMVALFAGFNRSYSRAYHILFIYLPLLLLIALAYLTQADELKTHSRKILIVLVTFVGVIVFGINRFNFLEIHLYYIELNNTYVPEIGLYTTPNTAQMFNRIQSTYRQYDCQNKALLAMDDLPSVYWITKRTPPFQQAWLSRILVVPFNKLTTGQNILQYLKQQGSWCVYFSTGSGKDSVEKKIGRGLIRPYLKANASKQIDLGEMTHRVNNGYLKSRPMGVTLYVRSAP